MHGLICALLKRGPSEALQNAVAMQLSPRWHLLNELCCLLNSSRPPDPALCSLLPVPWPGDSQSSKQPEASPPLFSIPWCLMPNVLKIALSCILPGYLVISGGKVNLIPVASSFSKAKVPMIWNKWLMHLRMIPQGMMGPWWTGEHKSQLNRQQTSDPADYCHSRIYALNYHIFHLFLKRLDFVKLFLISKHSGHQT